MSDKGEPSRKGSGKTMLVFIIGISVAVISLVVVVCVVILNPKPAAHVSNPAADDGSASAHNENSVGIDNEINEDVETTTKADRQHEEIGNECNPSPCNDGTCVVLNGYGYQCVCAEGFEGKDCNHNINDCASNPCQHDSICRDSVMAFTCDCKPGFVGKLCETDFNECASGPCLHGWCVDAGNMFVCQCAPGYEGRTCEIDIDNCHQNPCGNNGKCLDIGSTFYCDCDHGYTGPDCSIHIDHCSQNPCGNNGICLDIGSDFHCDCNHGYTGSDCSTQTDHCSQNPCGNNGSCLDIGSDFHCDCNYGYTGSDCSTQSFCDSNPCKNNGNCTEVTEGFRCECPFPIIGTLCHKIRFNIRAFDTLALLTDGGVYAMSVALASTATLLQVASVVEVETDYLPNLAMTAKRAMAVKGAFSIHIGEIVDNVPFHFVLPSEVKCVSNTDSTPPQTWSQPDFDFSAWEDAVVTQVDISGDNTLMWSTHPTDEQIWCRFVNLTSLI